MAENRIPPSRPAGPRLRVSLAVLLFGVIAVVVAFIGLGEALVHTVSDAAILSSPGSESVNCKPGSYVLYVESGSPPLPTAPGSVVVTSPGGMNVPLELQSRSETVTRGGARFSGKVSFSASTSGSYTITVRASGITVLVAPSFTTIARENLGWVVLLVAGFLATLTGLVLVIVGAVRRSRERRQAVVYGPGPFGGGPSGPWHQGGPPWAGPPPGPWSSPPAWPPPPPPAGQSWPNAPVWSPAPTEQPPDQPEGWPRPSPPSGS